MYVSLIFADNKKQSLTLRVELCGQETLSIQVFSSQRFLDIKQRVDGDKCLATLTVTVDTITNIADKALCR